MIKYDNDCADCVFDCIGNRCPYYSIAICTCDECHEELLPEELYIYEDGSEKMLCKDCLLKHFKTLDECWEYYQN